MLHFFRLIPAKSLFCLILVAFAATACGRPAERIIVMGDSLSAAYQIPMESGWVALMETELSALGCDVEVINAAISGETTAGGLTRLPDLLEAHQPTLVILELGANDGLRGLDLGAMESNMRQMIEMSQAVGAGVALLGIQIPTNYGRRYGERLAAVYPRLAAEYEASLMPFFLQDVALDETLMLDDRIHPNQAAQPLLKNAVVQLVADELTHCDLSIAAKPAK